MVANGRPLTLTGNGPKLIMNIWCGPSNCAVDMASRWGP